MKNLLKGVALAVLLAASPAVAQTPPGVLVVGQIAEPQTLDPQVSTAANDFRILTNVFEGLVRFAEGTLEVEPALATEWTVDEDGLVYTFTLREGVTFHDGTPFNADAVKFTFDRMLDEDHPFYGTGPFPLSFNFADVDSVEVIDEYTVEFTLGVPFAPFLTNLATNTGVIVSPSAVEEFGEDFGRNPVGTGPFQFEEWASNTRVVVSRYDDYWGDPAGVETVVFRPITDANTRVAEMLSGGIDIMVEVPPDNVAMFADDPSFTVYDAVGPHVWYVMLNALEGPFADPLVRQAANYAVNKESLVNDVLQGTAGVSTGPIPPAFAWAYNDDVAAYPYDPDRARELIEESGVEDLSVTFYVTEGGSGMLDPVPMGTAIQADLAAVGFDVTIETYEWNTFLANVNPGLEGRADMAQMAWMTTDPDTLPFLTLRTAAWPDEGGFNSSYYSNLDVDELLDQARMAVDQETRAELYREVHALVNADAPWIFVANWSQNAVSTDAVEGFDLQPDFNLVLRNVTKD